MSDIKTFDFKKEEFSKIKEYRFGYNWPVVYILENRKEIYIGQSTNVYNRSRQHIENPERQKLKNIHIVTDEEYNMSASFDIEALLIDHIVADQKFIVQNGNKGIRNHNYFDRVKYQAKFEDLWKKLQTLDLVNNELIQIRNSQIFKYSPYKSLTEDQLDISLQIKSSLAKSLAQGVEQTYVIDGGPGTGKTILATYLVKNLTELDEFKHLKIGFVVPMTSLRKTISRVFSKIKGLKSSMVIGPADVVREKYDLLIVDESHRLKQRKNLSGYGPYDKTNRLLELDNSGTELDWILKSSKYQIFFYDKNQSVRPADVDHSRFAKLDAIRLKLEKQQRVKGGDRYIQFIQNTLDLEPSECNFEEYDFKIFDKVSDMVSAIKDKDKEYGLCRVVAGYAWSWKTRDGGDYDIEIDGLKLKWNSTTSDWVNSKESINEVGCIHTVQGYDLNYTGVIIGPELSYDPSTHSLIIHKDKYEDINGKRSIGDPEELKSYIINIYKTLMTRGIYGTYLYVVDDNLRNYLVSATKDLNFT